VRVCGGGIKGTTTVVKIWGAPLTSGDYDIYLDENQDGKINPIDAVYAHLWIGFTVVPEFATIAIPAIAVLGLFLFFNKRKHKKE
jgi:hypothetical protein